MTTSSDAKQAAIETHSQQADEFEAAYTAGGDAYRSCFAYSRRRLEAWLERSLPAAPAGQRLLDVGCGTGHHLAALRQRGFEVAGVDGSQVMLDRARRHNPGVDLRCSDVESLPFADASFDLVLSVEVLRYLPKPGAAIREMGRVLRSGGRCLATALPLF